MSYKLIISVVPQYAGELITNTARDAGCPGGTVLMGRETSENGIIQLLGFGDAPKDITYNVADDSVECNKNEKSSEKILQSEKIMNAIIKATENKKRKYGIMFSLDVGNFIKAGSLSNDNSDSKNCGEKNSTCKTASKTNGEKIMNNSYEMINVIVNKGYAEDAMAAARKAGAGGGTIIQARGTAREGDAKFFGAEIVPEKDMLMILVPCDKKEEIIKAITGVKCFQKAGSGIVFTNQVQNFTVLGKK
ncbi:MAG: transcriptional regulator [Treponema sp.]|nr:transcriptional regulator [Candidatus Treponema merdequi]